ncbi:MAG: transposase [Paenisporosarcina sp.]
MKDSTPIKRWVEAFGEKGLLRKRQKRAYSVQFKLDVLSFMKRIGSSETETALHFGLSDPSLIPAWKKAFIVDGAEVMERPKGRLPMADIAMSSRKHDTKSTEMTNEQKLIRENELLRLEVEYLK